MVNGILLVTKMLTNRVQYHNEMSKIKEYPKFGIQWYEIPPAKTKSILTDSSISIALISGAK